MAIYHARQVEEITAGEGKEFLAFEVEAAVADELRTMTREQAARFEEWLRADVSLAQGLAREKVKAPA